MFRDEDESPIDKKKYGVIGRCASPLSLSLTRRSCHGNLLRMDYGLFSVVLSAMES